MEINEEEESPANNIVLVECVNMFFAYLEDNEPASFFLSINNIVGKVIFNESDIDSAGTIWSEFTDVEAILNKNGMHLEKITDDIMK